MIALLLLLGGGGGVFIVRDFSRRLGFLQNAIHRIAGGDLSTPVRTRAGDEMAELASELEAMRSALLEGRNQGMRMLMSVSHDLGTPLTTILGYVEALEDDVFPDRESRTRSLQAIRNKAELLQDRIGQLVEFVRIGSGAEEVEWEQVRLAGYLRETAESMRSDADVSGRRFIWSVEVPEADTISMSRPLMNRLFENLFQNALRYTREHDTMRLRAWAERPQFVVVFEDSGPGFTDMDPEESFELFRRGSHGRNEPGSGMGLATVKSIAQMHGFTVEAGTSELGGAAFTLRGPLHSAA
jgi:two-component system sensor histidine kinase BaeS